MNWKLVCHTKFLFHLLLFYSTTNSVSCGDQSPTGFIGKVDSGVGVYSRVAYDSWPFNAMTGAHTAIKPDVSYGFFLKL